MANLAQLVYKVGVTKLPFKKNSLLFAPMEGVTDAAYRTAIERAFPEWDYYSTDFYRVPTVGKVSSKALIHHFGDELIKQREVRGKTSYQILTSARAQTKDVASAINELNFEHLDLNLGCPSKKVNAHKGGAYLLSDIKELTPIIRDIRTSFNKCFTVKIRVGYKDDSLFGDLIKMFEDEGVDGITIHARTRDQLYLGTADWNYFEKALATSKVPIIANGDVWTIEDIIRMNNTYNPYAIMIGRGAMKTPWLATLWEQYRDNPDFLTDEFLLEERKSSMDIYFFELEKEYIKKGLDDNGILKRFKALSRYIFDDFPQSEEVKSKFVRSETLQEFKDRLMNLINS
jgi:tRNA-dihydrouridine synthase